MEHSSRPVNTVESSSDSVLVHRAAISDRDDWELGISDLRVLVERTIKKGVWPEESNMFIGSDKEYSCVSLQQTGKVQELTQSQKQRHENKIISFVFNVCDNRFQLSDWLLTFPCLCLVPSLQQFLLPAG